MTLFFAGMDTTATSAGLAIYGITRHESVYKQLNQEFSNFPDLTFEDLSQLHYCHAAIKETLRKWPVVGSAIPRQTVKPAKIKNFTIPKDTYVTYCFLKKV